jgi:glucose/arabinose dehydrogenase
MPVTRRRLLGFIVSSALLGLGCGDADPTPPASPGTTPAGSVAPATSAPAASDSGSPAPSAGPAGPFDPTGVAVSLEVVTDGLDAPLAIAHAGDGSGRLFVAEQGGRVRVIRDGTLDPDPLLDISDRISAGGERGLLGLAFHPDFARNPRVFVDYTDRAGHTVVSSFTATDGEHVDTSNETIILRVEQPYANHNGGALAFGPDGYLYVATGDGGAGGDPHDFGQALDTHLGKILRLDVDTSSADRAYAIPDDNPFVDRDGAAPEIWLTGLRNPWRLSFDRTTGDLWIGDVGQGAWEEIDVARSGRGGLNFGWNVREGFECYPPEFGECDSSGLTMPVAVYGHEFGCSVTGGLVYRGSAQPALAGGYVFADYCSGNVWLLDPSTDGPQEPPLVLESGRSISSFGEDETGEAYATDLAGGALVRLVATTR